MAKGSTGAEGRANGRTIVRACLEPSWVIAMALVLLVVSPVAADGHRLVILRRDQVKSELAGTVDRELAAALAARAHVESAYFSPTPYEDIELAADCHGATAECVERVAQSLAEERVLVRELATDDRGGLVLRLTTQDGPRAGVRSAEGKLHQRGDDAPAAAVSRLVEALYPTVSLVAQREVEPTHGLRVAGYGTLGASGALLAAGIAMAVVGHNDHARYADVDVRDAGSAERADALLDDARRRTHTANALFGAAAALGTTGLGFVLWDQLRARRRERAVTLDVYAAREVAGFTLRGRL